MKILVVGNTPNARTTGMGRCIHGLRDEWVKAGHDVDLILAKDVPQFPTRRLQSLLFPFLIVSKMKRMWREKGKHDIVHIHSTDAAYYTFLRKRDKSLPPCIVISYGADELRWELEKEEERLGFIKIRPLSKILYPNIIVRQARYATKNCDHVFVAASYEIGFYQGAYGVLPEKVTFVPNGVGDEFFVERQYESSKKLLFMGGWEWRKGTRYLIEAFTELASRDSEVVLSIVGSGGDREAIKNSFPETIRDRVTVIPHVDASEVLKFYQEHDIFVFPSLFESMSLVVPEAMASAMPVVTTEACGMQDIVENGKNGLLVPPRDAQALVKSIESLLGDLEKRKRLGEAAQLKARTITWKQVADQELQVCQKLIEKEKELESDTIKSQVR